MADAAQQFAFLISEVTRLRIDGRLQDAHKALQQAGSINSTDPRFKAAMGELLDADNSGKSVITMCEVN